MKAKWRKMIWLLLVLQLYVVHGWLLSLLSRYFQPAFIMGWMLVAAALLIWRLTCYASFRKLCFRQMKPFENTEVKEQFREVYEQTVSRRRTWPLYCGKDIFTPFVIGVRRPVLLLPEKDYKKEAVRLVFQHECHHIQVKDNWYKLFLLVSQCILWYQPLVYLLQKIAVRDIEVACDEAVVEGKSVQERYAYGQVLLENLQELPERHSSGWSSYFYNGKSVMKARMKAVMDQDRKRDLPAYAAIVILLLETVFFGWKLAEDVREQVRFHEEPVNIYEGYELPDSFTDSAIEKMLSVEGETAGVYNTLLESQGDTEYSDTDSTAIGPWQVKSRFTAVEGLLDRYFYYYEDQIAGSQAGMENGVTKSEIRYQFELAGGKDEAVFYVIAREYYNEDLELLPLLQEEIPGIYSRRPGEDYIYYCLALYVARVDDYVYELRAVADGSSALEAFKEAYPERDYSMVARWEPVKNDIGNYGCRLNNQVLQVTRDGGITWEQTPVYQDELFERGDQMDGVLNSVQEGSAQTDEKKIIFAYGGSSALPVTVAYPDSSGQWQKTEVTDKYFSVRRFFVSFPENSQVGYLILTTDRVVWQEGSILFRTKDGGAAWEEAGPAGPDFMTSSHSLTTGAVFVTNEVGFLTIRSSGTEQPEIWRTKDGGDTWERQELPEVPEYFSMAYAPELSEDGSLDLFVGMEDYAEYSGEKAYYRSGDLGETWNYQGQVIRK